MVFYDQEPLALFCSLLTVHTNISHATTNLPFMVQQLCSDKSVDYFEYLACGLALSPEIFHAGHSQKGATLMARAEVFDWSEKRIDTSSFEMVCAQSNMLRDFECYGAFYLQASLPFLFYEEAPQ